VYPDGDRLGVAVGDSLEGAIDRDPVGRHPPIVAPCRVATLGHPSR
jgi:hypothetical protein